MEEHSIPVGHLVFPILLPLAQSGFLQQAVSLDDELWSGSLESHATLDTDDGVAHVAVATDGVGCTNLFNLLDGSNLVVEFLSVHGYYLALVECNLQCGFLFLGGHVLQIGFLGQSLCRVEQLATTDTCTPNTHVV